MRTHFCPFGCPARDHKSTHEKTALDQMAESGDTTMWSALAGGRRDGQRECLGKIYGLEQ